MTTLERASRFDCDGVQLQAIQAAPAQGARRGVLIVVGGEQYRADSHRQFVLIARHLAAHGLAVLRFDFSGMGDSAGTAVPFDQRDAQLRAAIDHFFDSTPGLAELVLLGLCDGASAISLYAGSDPRVRAVVLLNPWMDAQRALAKATLKHYYVKRLLQRDFWRKVGRAEFRVGVALRDAVGLLASARRRESVPAQGDGPGLAERMLTGLREFSGRILIVLSAEDLTARQFSELARDSRAWRALLAQPRCERRTVEGADHTFSRRLWREHLCAALGEWSATW